MKRFLRLAGIVMAILMAVSAFAGCGGSTESTGTTAGTTEAAATSIADTKTEPAAKGPSWKLDTSPVTLDWFINLDWYSNKWDTTQLAYKIATEKTGVSVNIMTPTAGANEKLNVMIASDDLPDIITTGGGPQLDLLKSAAKIEPLIQLMEKDAPTFLDILPESMVKWYSEADGNFYQIPDFYMSDSEMGPENYYECNNTIVARKDIMDQLGIKPEDFSTQDGMIAALKKVQAANIMYKDKKVSAFYAGPQAGVQEMFQWVIWDMFAVSPEAPDGSYADRRYAPKNLEALKFGNRLYREGLLEKDNFTAQRLQIEEKITAGGVFCFLGNKGDYGSPFRKVMETDPNAQYIAVGPVRALDGGMPTYRGSSAGWLHTVISKASPNKTRAIRFLEYMYSEEGTFDMTYGIEGQTYTMGENGHIVYTEQYLKDEKERSEAELESKYALDFYIFNNWPLVQAHNPLPTTPEDNMFQKLGDFNKQFQYNNMCETNIDPNPDSDESINKKKIDDYYTLQVTKMLMAKNEQEVETIYNETIKHMDELGNQAVIKAMNDKFQANKKKLGVNFVFPTNIK